MTEFSHRDRRAHRAVARGFIALGIAVLSLGVLAFVAPTALVGELAVLGLGVTGLVYLRWSQHELTEYETDLRTATGDTERSSFLRVEARSSVALDRPVGRLTERSPHVRSRKPSDRFRPPPEEDGSRAAPRSGA